MEINNKVAIVTGGIGGIGFATVQYLLRNHAEYVAMFDVPGADSVAAIKAITALEEEGFENDRFDYYTCDVTNVKQFKECYEHVKGHKGYVDILVNNAAVANDKNVDLSVDVNFKSVINCTMIGIEHMGKHTHNKGGVIVNIASFLGLVNRPLAPVYNGTKHAVVSFVRSMKDHNKTLGVRIVCICPGMTKTNMPIFDSFRRDMFDFVSSETIKEALSIHQQKPGNVASAIVEIIKKGKEGDVWVAQDDQPPFAVKEETDLEKLRV